MAIKAETKKKLKQIGFAVGVPVLFLVGLNTIANRVKNPTISGAANKVRNVVANGV